MRRGTERATPVPRERPAGRRRGRGRMRRGSTMRSVHAGTALEQRRVGAEERSEGVRPRLRGEVEDDDPAVGLEADRDASGSLVRTSGAAPRPSRRRGQPWSAGVESTASSSISAFEREARRHRPTIAAARPRRWRGTALASGPDRAARGCAHTRSRGRGRARTSRSKKALHFAPCAMPASCAYCRGTQTPECRITSARNRAWRSVKPRSTMA